MLKISYAGCLGQLVYQGRRRPADVVALHWSKDGNISSRRLSTKWPDSSVHVFELAFGTQRKFCTETLLDICTDVHVHCTVWLLRVRAVGQCVFQQKTFQKKNLKTLKNVKKNFF